MNDVRKLLKSVTENEQFLIDAKDFLSARDQGGSAVTKLAQLSVSLAESAQVLNSSHARQDESGVYTNVISPVVMPKDSRSWFWVFQAGVLFVVGLLGAGFFTFLEEIPGVTNIGLALFGPHYWLLWLAFVAFSIWKNSYVEIPDGCQALIMKYGKVEETVGPGRKWLFHPRKKVGYVVNTTKEYPYNAPIRQAPTQGRVEASVDLFLQFRIEDPSKFIFTLGGVNGFSEKLYNAVGEVTRALIYEQKAEEIYELVGESTQSLLNNLNKQFLPAVRFVNANITHAEPASQEYRMDLAAAEIMKVAKEAYTYQYELQLRKEQDEGELNKELASLRETLSEIKAEIATYQAQIDTARGKAVNQANAYARQLLIEAESEAKANAALLEAQSLDIKAVNNGRYPEILEYRFQREILDKIEAIADRLPQVINIGPQGESQIDYMTIARQVMGIKDTPLYSEEDLSAIRARINDIKIRITERNKQIKQLLPDNSLPTGEII
jgi:regulator of protease activity HflC (stomatin/prohibitin superfamily)